MSYDPNQPAHAPYGGPAPAPYSGLQASGGSLLTVGQNREPLTVILLSIVTCGIYALWWSYTYATEIKNALGREELNPGMDIVLTFVTCGLWGVYAFYFKYPKLLTEMQPRAGLPVNDISLITLLMAFVFSPVSFFLIQSELNKIWDAARRPR